MQPLLISFPDPPLRDWKFDIAIRTADPFRIQSNLANGRITGNLTFGGTGLEPWLDGTLYVERLTATLPFSQLRIDSSVIYFTRDNPFMPQLDMRGTSNIRDYRINVLITGPLTNRKPFRSDPPLPVGNRCLIATGSTTGAFRRPTCCWRPRFCSFRIYYFSAGTNPRVERFIS
jgi:hypothetical protein